MWRCSVRQRVITGIAIGLLAASPAPVLAHGGEDDTLEKTPARALAQQALGLLSQEESAVEAHERVEAALESEDKAGVDQAKLRETQDTFEIGDHERAAQLLNEALVEGGSSEPVGEPADGQHGAMEEGDEAAADTEPAASSFEHTREFKPGRATPEWIAAATGLLALGGAAGALARSGAGRRGHSA